MKAGKYYVVYKYKKPEGRQSGDKSGTWKGGRAMHERGYMMVVAWDHPFCNHMGYVMEHRLIWETYHRANLLPWSNVHHLNDIKTDNRPENLQAMMIKQHTIIHHTDPNMDNRRCFLCGDKTYLRYNGRNEWYLDPNDKTKFHCRKCHRRIEYANKQKES